VFHKGRLSVGGNGAFCVIGNVGGKLKDAATRCVLWPINASKSFCGLRTPLQSLQRSPRLPSWIWRGKWEGKWKGLDMEKEWKEEKYEVSY